MRSEWKKYRFSELCEISRGASPRPIKDYISDNGMPWVKIADATGTASRFITSTKEKIKIQGVSKSKVVIPGDLILSNSATPGLPKFMNIEACIHDGWMLLRNFQNLDKNFAYWLLLNERNNLVMQGNGSVFTNLKTDILKNHEVSIPDEDFQRVIASILNSIQDKIELNTQINKTLEEMAQAIFKSWFVDFDPVKAKMTALASGGTPRDAELAAMSVISGKDKDELVRFEEQDPDAYKELAETAALFPSCMQDSELGEIPEGWEVKSISEMVSLIGGGTPKRSESSFWDGVIPWFSVRDVPSDGDVFVIDTIEKITKNGLNNSSTNLLEEGTTIITARGTVGKLALVGKSMCMNQSCYGLVGNDMGALCTYFVIKGAVPFLKRNTHGAVFDTITSNTFNVCHSIFSNKELAIKFENKVESSFNKIKHNLYENQSLIELRDAILPKLLSGELDVRSVLQEEYNEC